MSFLRALIGITVLGMGIEDAAACDRALSPLETPAVGVAVADAVVVAEVTSIGGGTGTFQIKQALKGGKGSAAGDTIRIRGVLSSEEGMQRMRCGVAPMEVGKRYILMVWNPPAESAEFDLIDPLGGVREHSAAQLDLLKEALAKQHPHSAWKTSSPGVQAQLVLAPQRGEAKGDVDLFLLLRNVGRSAIELKYRSWPEALQSKCTLHIVNTATKQKVEAREVPIKRKEIADYFSRHGRIYGVKLASGDSHVFSLFRVTSAKPGWGYKEELGFRYYPVDKPGLHTVSAECENLFGADSRIMTESLNLIL